MFKTIKEIKICGIEKWLKRKAGRYGDSIISDVCSNIYLLDAVNKDQAFRYIMRLTQDRDLILDDDFCVYSGQHGIVVELTTKSLIKVTVGWNEVVSYCKYKCESRKP